jgi:DNA-binding NarL/FixJ family response regulator
VTCVVADDHPPITQLLAEYLAEHDVDVVGRALDGAAALEQITATEPAVALLDARMPELTGVDVARELTRTGAPTAVILYTGYGERSLLIDALDAGARGFVQKEAALEEVVRAVRVVAAGGTYVDPVLGAVFATPQAADRLPSLTARERDVLRLLADGLTNEAVGKRLFISPDTVRAHLRKAMAKLEADTRTEAVATALRQSLIS